MDNDKIRPTGPQRPIADTGYASYPTPHNECEGASVDQQLLGKDAEKYLRESGNIEDMPDAQDWKDANKKLKEDEE
jgi:hypothetical protein